MARVNVGIAPYYLSDNHLIAESVEITMITGSLRRNNYLVKGAIPKNYTLGAGHINFFKDKLLYLANRLQAVNTEMRTRKFNPGTSIDLSEFPEQLINDWTPDLRDSEIVRARVCDRIVSPLKLKRPHRYYGQSIIDISKFTDRLLNSPLSKV